MINGQDKLKERLQSYTISTLPHTVLLIGEEGCGKHEMAKFISEKFNLEMREFFKQDLTVDSIIDLYCSTTPKLILINIDNFFEKEQSIILKLIEEPTEYIYVFLITESQSLVTPTILGRCITFKFEPYSDSYLLQFCNDTNKLKFLRTPGKLLNCSDSFDEIVNLCKMINDKINSASIGNILSISDKLSFKKDDNSKIPVSLFINVLKHTIESPSAYKRILKAEKDLRFNIDKKFYIQNFLIELKFLLK